MQAFQRFEGGSLAQSVEHRTLDRGEGSILGVCAASLILGKDNSPPFPHSTQAGESGYQFYWGSFQRQTDVLSRDRESHLSAKRHRNLRLAPTLWALWLEKTKPWTLRI